jgi:ribosomal protein L22
MTPDTPAEPDQDATDAAPPEQERVEPEATEAKAPRKLGRARKPKAPADAAEGEQPGEQAKPAKAGRARKAGAAAADDEGKQAKPARKRAARKAPAAPQAETPAEAKAEEAEKPEKPERKPAAKPARRGRGPARVPRRRVVRAHARYVRTSARKARMVCGHLRGKSVQEARAILAFTPREVARDWSKLLESAVANAESNHELLEDDLIVREAYADEGPTIKRFRPRAMGRATPIRKRTSHLTIALVTRPEPDTNDKRH